MSRHSNLMNFMDIRQQMLQRLRGESLFAYRIPDAFRARASESPVAASSLLILKSEVSTCCQCHCNVIVSCHLARKLFTICCSGLLTD